MKEIGDLVREILGRSRGYFSPSKVLTLQSNDIYRVQDRIAYLYNHLDS